MESSLTDALRTYDPEEDPATRDVTVDYRHGDLFVKASQWDTPHLRSIAGARYIRRGDYWRMPATRTQFSLLSFYFGERINSTDAARHHARKLFSEPKPRSLKLDLRLFPFQQEGVSHLVNNGSGILADEMGTGKTIQAIMWMANLADWGKHLVVCPATMKYKWAAEIEAWWPEAPVTVVDGTAAKRRKAIEGFEGGVMVINYESLRTHTKLAPWGGKKLTEKQSTPKELNDIGWDTVVVDEAHKIKSPKALQTLAVRQMGLQAEYRLAMTGTPIVNNPDDLWSIWSFVDPQEAGSRNQFRNSFCEMAPGWQGSWENKGFRPDRREAFDRAFTPRFLRRTKVEVLPQLPEKFPIEYRKIDLTPKQSKLYSALEEDMIALAEGDQDVWATTSPIELVGKLRFIASAMPVQDEEGHVASLELPSNKLDALRDIVSDDPSEPIVVYASSRKLIELFATELAGDGRRVGMITGAVKHEDRADIVSRFQNGELDTLLGTVGAAAEGITLTRARTIVLAQQDWSNVANQQAIDRVHRIGQTRGVQPIVLMSANTIDESVRWLADEKGARLEDLVRDAEKLRQLMRGEYRG